MIFYYVLKSIIPNTHGIRIEIKILSLNRFSITIICSENTLKDKVKRERRWWPPLGSSGRVGLCMTDGVHRGGPLLASTR